MATRTIAILTPNSAEFPSTAFPQLQTIHSTERVPVLSYDTTTEETAVWTLVAPVGFAASLGIVVNLIMASATSGNVALHVAIELMTSVALATAASWDTIDTSANTAVPGTLIPFQIALTMTHIDSIAAGSPFRIKITRDTGNASNAAADMHLLNVEVKDGL
jgi:hypothetical protein